MKYVLLQVGFSGIRDFVVREASSIILVLAIFYAIYAYTQQKISKMVMVFVGAALVYFIINHFTVVMDGLAGLFKLIFGA